MIGDTIDGRYQLVGHLGEGGMGAVYEGRHTGTGRRVAVKVIKGGATEVQIERFAREARAAGALETQHVAQVFDIGTDGQRGTPYIVMELLAGEDLSSLIQRRGRLPEDLVLRIAAQACVGLAKAHELGIVHRDIKPANLFLAARDGGELVVKLLDFGVAKFHPGIFGEASEGLTATGTMVGTPHYVSPEQAKGQKDLDARTDIWSLGAVMYRALTGRVPFERGESITEMLFAICTDPPTPLSSLAPGISPATMAIIDRALQKPPDLRWPTAQAMMQAIVARLPDGFAIHETMLATTAGNSVPDPQASTRRDPVPTAPTAQPPAGPPPNTLPSPGSAAPSTLVSAGRAAPPVIVAEPAPSPGRGLVLGIVGAALLAAVIGAIVVVRHFLPDEAAEASRSTAVPRSTEIVSAVPPSAPPPRTAPPPKIEGERKIDMRALRIFDSGDKETTVIAELHNVGPTPLQSPRASIILVDVQSTKLASGSCTATFAILPPGAMVPCAVSIRNAAGWTAHIVQELESDAVRGDARVPELVVDEVTLHPREAGSGPYEIDGKVTNRGAFTVRVRVYVELYGASGTLAGVDHEDVVGDKLEPGTGGRFSMRLYRVAEEPTRVVALPMRLPDKD